MSVPVIRKFYRAFVDFDTGLFQTIPYCKAGVLPVAAVFDEACSQRVGFDVLQNLEVVRIFLDGKALEPALVYVTDACCSVGSMPAA